MPYPLFFGDKANEEVIDAWTYYEELRPGLGDLFISEMDKLLSQISAQPLLFPLIYGQKRRAILRRFHFNIFFVFDGKSINVLAVMHQSRNPKRWKKR